jgi:hypothetical protein
MKTYSRENDLVIVTFSGSGTGFERIKKEKQQIKMF